MKLILDLHLERENYDGSPPIWSGDEVAECLAIMIGEVEGGEVHHGQQWDIMVDRPSKLVNKGKAKIEA